MSAAEGHEPDEVEFLRKGLVVIAARRGLDEIRVATEARILESEVGVDAFARVPDVVQRIVEEGVAD